MGTALPLPILLYRCNPEGDGRVGACSGDYGAAHAATLRIP